MNEGPSIRITRLVARSARKPEKQALWPSSLLTQGRHYLLRDVFVSGLENYITTTLVPTPTRP